LSTGNFYAGDDIFLGVFELPVQRGLDRLILLEGVCYLGFSRSDHHHCRKLVKTRISNRRCIQTVLKGQIKDLLKVFVKKHRQVATALFIRIFFCNYFVSADHRSFQASFPFENRGLPARFSL
jgi:hypothetical protein